MSVSLNCNCYCWECMGRYDEWPLFSDGIKGQSNWALRGILLYLWPTAASSSGHPAHHPTKLCLADTSACQRPFALPSPAAPRPATCSCRLDPGDKCLSNANDNMLFKEFYNPCRHFAILLILKVHSHLAEKVTP